MSAADRVRIHYRRLPDHEEIFDQRIVLEESEVVVTVTDPLDLPEPIHAGEQVALQSGSRAVWFTFPGAWHDIGRFHLRDGAFTGYYANVLTPVEIEGRVWRTTDLFLDVWLPEGGSATVLDVDELEVALGLAHIDPDTAAAARAEAERLVNLAAEGLWPPPVAREWTLERILADERVRGA